MARSGLEAGLTLMMSAGVPNITACCTMPLHLQRQSSRRQWKISLQHSRLPVRPPIKLLESLCW